MSELILPLRINHTNDLNFCQSIYHNIIIRGNFEEYIFRIIEWNNFLEITLKGSYIIVTQILKDELHKWDLKILTNDYSNFVVKGFILNDVGLFVVLENEVFNEIVEYYRKIHKNLFRDHIWGEMIQRVMRPDRLVKLAGDDLDLMDYMEQMGW